MAAETARGFVPSPAASPAHADAVSRVASSVASAAAAAGSGPVPRISVVIPTYRRPQLLARCLDAVLSQTLAPEAYEVIVVDDGQTDDTRALVESLAQAHPQGPRLRYLRPQGTRGPAAARNCGWRHARAPWIAFTDDDTLPERDWLAEGERCFDAGVAVALRGRVVVPLPQEFTDHAKMTQGLETADFVTANAFVQRAALAAIGGFDERFLRAWREDSDLCFMLQQLCGPVGRAPGAVVVHPVREAPWGLSLRQQANVYFDALLYKKHPGRYRREIRPVPPWRYYAIVGSTFGGLGSLLAGAWGPGLALLALAQAGIAGFALQRLKGTSHSARHVSEMLLTSAAIPFLSVYWRLAGAWRFKVLFL